MEGLTDRQAADAVRDRLAWKYALSLELTDTGFDHSVLSEFRSRLLEGKAEQRMPGSAAGALSAGWMAEPLEDGNATCSTHVLAKIGALNRRLCVGQTMVYVLDVRIGKSPRSGFVLTYQVSGSNGMESDSLMSVYQKRSKSASSTPIRSARMDGPNFRPSMLPVQRTG
jgi:hypothetical protein